MVSARLHKDAGSVLIEFALVLPVLLVLLIGSFDLALVWIKTMQLVFVTQEASRAEAQTVGSGAGWGNQQFPEANFVVSGGPIPGSNCVVGTFNYSPMFLPGSLFPAITNKACAI